MCVKTIVMFLIAALLVGCGTVGNLAGIKVEGLGDDFEELVTVSTRDYSRPYIVSVGKEDWFFRGYVNKKTKQPIYQMYMVINRHDAVYWDTAKYKKSGEISSHSLNYVGSDVVCGRGGCVVIEDVVLGLDRGVLENWKGGAIVRISSSKVSGHVDITIDPKEVEEFLKRVDLVVDAIDKAG